jgi:excisionase family DNA binding protein
MSRSFIYVMANDYRNARLISVKEAAQRLAVRPGTVRLWIRLRRLPSIRVGARAIRVPADAIEAIIERGYSPAKPEVVR